MVEGAITRLAPNPSGETRGEVELLFKTEGFEDESNFLDQKLYTNTTI